VAVGMGNTGATNQTITGVTLGGAAGNFGSSPVFASGSSASGRVEFWADPNCAGGQTAVQVTLNTSTGVITNAHVFELSGVATSTPFDQSAGAAWTSGTSFSSGATGTTAQAKEIAVGLAVEFTASGPPTVSGPSSPWVNVTQETNNFTGSSWQTTVAGTNILSSTGTQTYSGSSTITNGGAGRAGVITLKAASVGGLQVTSGTLSVRADVRMSDFRGAALAGKWGGTGQSWALLVSANQTITGPADGTLNLVHYDGSNVFGTPSTLPLPYFTGRIAIRADYNISAQTVTFFTAPTMAGSWTQLGDVKTTSAVSLSGGAGQAVQVGTIGSSTIAGMPAYTGMQGEVYEFQLLSTGVTLADPVFTSQTPGVSSFADAQANTWTLAGTAELSGRSYRFHGELAALPRTADPSGRNAYSQAQAGGITRRLQQQQNPASSAMARAYLRLPASLNLAAYWPAEDGAQATQIAAAVGGLPMGNPGVTMASFGGFACSGPLPVMNGASCAALVNPSSVTWTDNITRFLLAVPSGDDTNNAVIARVYSQGTVVRLELVYTTGGGLTLNGYNAAGSQVINFGFAFGLSTLAACRVNIGVVNAGGGNIQGSLFVITPGGQVAFGTTGGTFAGTVGGVTGVQFGGGLVGSAMGHFSVQGVNDNLFTDMGGFQARDGVWTSALFAWAHEPAGRRYARLCAEEGYQCRIIGPPDLSVAMGYQTQQTITQLLQECETTDQGLQYEPRQVLGLGYVTNRALCNQPVAATGNYAAMQVDQAFFPSSDDSTIINDVTMTTADGSSARQVLAAGNMSVQSPPSGAGRFDTSVQVNPVNDAQVASLAGWYLNVSSPDEDRYPSVPFQVARGTIPQAVPLMDIGSYLQLTNTPAWVPPGPVRQIVAGVAETIGPQPEWGIAFNCIPESPYENILLDDTVYGRVTSNGITVHANTAYGAGTFQFDTASGPLWTTTGGDFPVDLAIRGMRITVSACSGASSPQTFTVSAWGVNGVQVALVAGDVIELWYPPIAGLT